jgi:pimeloyl-ACP methyl ester carboxylesterase
VSENEGEAAGHQRYRDGHVLVSDGLRLHYRDYAGDADKPPLLCLPGLTRNVRDFEAFAKRYSPGHRIIALEFRGRGESDYDPVPSRYIPLTYAGDVIQVLDQLAIPQAIFVGTSLGGLVTMTLAAICPERIAAAILNDVGPELNRVGLDRIQSYLGKREHFNSWDAAAAAIAAAQGPAFPKYGHADWLEMARRNCREHDGEIVFDYDAAIADAFRTAGAVPKIDLWPLFAAVARKPLLIVRGALSELLSAESASKMRHAAPNAIYAEVPDMGHAPMLDEPEAVAAIDKFLKSLERP